MAGRRHIPTDADLEAQRRAGPNGQGDGQADTPPEDAAEEKAPASVLKRVLLVLAVLVGLVLLFIGLFIGALQTNWASQRVGDAILGLANPFDEAAIRVGDIDGNWLTGLRLYDVNIDRVDSNNVVLGDSLRMAHIDTLVLDYGLLSILRGRIELDRVFASGLNVHMRQQADSTWDLFNALAQDTTQADTTRRGLVFEVADLAIRDASFIAEFYNPERDSVFRLNEFDTHVRNLTFGAPDEAISLDLDALQAEFIPPNAASPVNVTAEGQLADGRLMLDTFVLQSDRSDVAAQGSLRLPLGGHETLDEIDFQVHAEPLDFEDIAPFVAALDPGGSATFDARVEGSLDNLIAHAEGELSDGATFNIDADVTPGREGGPVAYEIDGQVRRLDPAFFTGGEGGTLLNADIQADLRGTSLDAADGSFRAELFDSRFGEYQPDRTVLSGTVAGGRADVELRSGLRGTGVSAEGWVRPFDEVPTYDLRGRLQDLDIARFTEGGEQSSDVSGTFRLEGSGFKPAEADLRAGLDLDPSRFNRYQINDGTLDVRLNGGDLSFDTRFAFPEGRVAARGNADLGGDVLTYRVTEGRLDNFDLAAFTGDTTRSSLNGSFALRGEGTDPQTMRLDDVRFDLADSYYGTYRIYNAEGRASLRGGRLNLDADARLDGGAFDVAGSLRPFDDVPTYTVTRGRFSNVQLGVLTGNPDLTTDLNGAVTLSGSGFDPRTMRLDANLHLVDSQYNEQYVDEGDLDLTLRRGDLTYEGRVVLPDGGATYLAGTAEDVFGEVPTFALREGSFQRLNLGALLGNPNLQTSLTGRVNFEGRGFNPQMGDFAARLELDESTINELTILGGDLDVEVESGFARVGGEVTFEQGVARLTASGRFFDEVPTFQAEGVIENLNLAELTGLDSLATGVSLTFDVEGEGKDPETMTLDAHLAASGTRYGEIEIDTLYTDLRLTTGLLNVEDLVLRSNVADADAGGDLALFTDAAPSDFRLDLEAKNLAPLRPFVDAEVLSVGESTLSMRAYGQDALAFDAKLQMESFAYNDIRLAGLETTLAGQLTDSLTLASAELDGEMGFFSVPQITVEQTTYNVNYNGDEIAFTTGLLVDQRRDATFTGVVDLRPDNRRVVIENLDMRFDQDTWELLQPASISYGDEYRISNFLVFSGDQQIALDGVIDLDGEQSLILTIEGFRIGSIADLLDFEGLDGTLDGTLDLTGPAFEPDMTGTLNFDILSYEQPVGDLELAVRYDSLRLNLDALLTHEDGSTLSLDGYVPMDLRLREPDPDAETTERALQVAKPTDGSDVALQLVADDFAIGWIEPFLDPEVIDEVEGLLSAQVDITGTFTNPQLSGVGDLSGGRIRLPEFGVTYDHIRADLGFDGNQMLVNHAELRSGDGSVIATGSLDLAELTLGEFDLDLSLENFLAVDNDEYRVEASGDLALSGTTQQPVLTGDVNVPSADIYLTGETNEKFEPIQLTERDLRMLEQEFGIRVTEEDTTTVDFYRNLTMDLDVELERDVWLRSEATPDMNIQFTGNLDVSKEPDVDPELFGTIEVIPQRSYIDQFGKRFAVTTGTLTFNGEMLNPYLNVEAVYKVPSRRNQSSEISITLGAEGRLQELEITLTSDPPTDYTNIVSYIATGRPADEAFQLGGARDFGTNVALGELANIVENAAGSELGLDVIEIQQDGLNGASVTAGKYLSQRLYVSISQPIAFNGSTSRLDSQTNERQFIVEYEVFEWLLLRALSEGATVRVNFLYEYAY